MEQSVKNEYDALRVKDLLLEGYDTETLAAKFIGLQDEFDDLEREFEETSSMLSSYESAEKDRATLATLAEAVSSSYFSAEVAYVDQRTFGHQILLDVDITPGEALDVRAGHRVTLALAPAQDFAALYQEV